MAYSYIDQTLGTPDLTTVAVGTASLGAPGVTGLPSITTDTQLGTIIRGRDLVNGDGEFIFLRVPVSTTVTPGLLYFWDKNYTITVVPVTATAKNSGYSVAAALNTVASNATAIQYTWFQIVGQAVVLKTAVAIPPASKIYVSGTAGRVYVTASSGAQIEGARSANTATVTSTTSSVLVFLNRSNVEGA